MTGPELGLAVAVFLACAVEAVEALTIVLAVGITRGWQYEEVQFYPDQKRHAWIKRVAPFFWVESGNDRAQGGTELYVLPGIRFNWPATLNRCVL